jgi:hypothetical protein
MLGYSRQSCHASPALYYYEGLIPDWIRTDEDLTVQVHEYNMPDYSLWSSVVYRPSVNAFGIVKDGEWPYVGAPSVNAPAEVQEAFSEYHKAMEEISNARQRMARNHTPEKGKLVEVEQGPRKRKNAGFRGRVFWKGVNQFRQIYRNGYNSADDPKLQVLGIMNEDTGEKRFVPCTQCVVIGGY